MSFDQLLLAGESKTREFKTSFETDRLLEADLKHAVINKLLNILWIWARNMPWLHVKYAGCFRSALLSYAANEQPFVSTYRLALSVKDELLVELKRERQWLAEQKRSEGKNVF